MKKEVSKENLYDDRPVGVLDSGVGGLTVLKNLVECMPNEKFIYFGDTKNLPYGCKSPKLLLEAVKNIFDFFIKKDVKTIIHGCNTTSAVVYDLIKDDYDFPIYPLIQCACKNISAEKCNKIGIFATQATVNSKMYTKSLQEVNKDINVCEIACPEWVNIVETGTMNDAKNVQIIGKYVNEMAKFNPDKIILGCTHYPYLMDVLAKFIDAGMFINPAKAFADYIKKDLSSKGLLSNAPSAQNEFYVSANPERFLETGKMFFPLTKAPELI